MTTPTDRLGAAHRRALAVVRATDAVWLKRSVSASEEPLNLREWV